MPHITFVLPHWLYWGGLILVPFFAMYIVRKQRGMEVDGILSKRIAYLLWFCGGFIGLHRFYVRNVLGFVYIPIFIALLLFNVQVRNAVEGISDAKKFRFGMDGTLLEYGLVKNELNAIIDSGKPFCTSGCPDNDGGVACNRPYANSLPGPHIRNYPFPPNMKDIEQIRAQLWTE